jgi:beta-glucosidase
VCIVVVGENPYVEFNGDVENLNLSRKDTDIIKRVSQLKVPKVLIILSGRPVIITEYIPSFSSVVAAWWFGTEAEGLTDILFGDYKPTGKLPFSWPKDNSQLPLNVGDTNYDPLFPFGYGLTY